MMMGWEGMDWFRSVLALLGQRLQKTSKDHFGGKGNKRMFRRRELDGEAKLVDGMSSWRRVDVLRLEAFFEAWCSVRLRERGGMAWHGMLGGREKERKRSCVNLFSFSFPSTCVSTVFCVMVLVLRESELVGLTLFGRA